MKNVLLSLSWIAIWVVYLLFNILMTYIADLASHIAGDFIVGMIYILIYLIITFSLAIFTFKKSGIYIKNIYLKNIFLFINLFIIAILFFLNYLYISTDLIYLGISIEIYNPN